MYMYIYILIRICATELQNILYYILIYNKQIKFMHQKIHQASNLHIYRFKNYKIYKQINWQPLTLI